MLSDLLIRNIISNKKYYGAGFYKNEFREFEGNIELNDGQLISYEVVEERMREEMNYFDPLYHILEMNKEVNEGYYCNMVFFNKCDSKGYWDGFDVNGFNKKGYNKKGFNKKGFNKKGFNRKGYDGMGYNKKGFNRKGYSRWGGHTIDDMYDPAGYNANNTDDMYDPAGYD